MMAASAGVLRYISRFAEALSLPVIDRFLPDSLIRALALIGTRACTTLLVFLACWIGVSANAQVPIPLQEQIRAFSALPVAQQQALIRELQRQLPPAQRDAVLSMLQGGATTSAGDAGDGVEVGPDASQLATSMLGSLEVQQDESRLRPGDTLVIEFAPRDADVDVSPQGPAEQRESEDFLRRLEDGNPYKLDTSGRLQLPGVPSIELAGLDIDQATIRLGAERDLRPFEIIITQLPLEPVGEDALESFGYELFAGVPSTFAPATDIPVPVDYVVGPGDTINVQLFGNENAEYFLTVSREGLVNFPELGPLNVSGLTFTDVRNLVNERVSEQMIGVRASTTLGELRSIRIFVLGDVMRPGSYTISGLATMTNALFASGGVTEIGSLRRIALNRAGQTITTLDLYDLLLRGDTSGDARLQPGDVIFVPTIGATVAIDGEVRRPAIYELNDERSVSELIEMAGGLNANANRDGLKLERIVPGGVSVSDLTLASAVAADVRDGDVIRVERNLDQLEGSVRLVGNVQRPGLYQWRQGMTVGDLLPSPEFVKSESDLGYVVVRRELASNVRITVLSVDLEGVWDGRPGSVDLNLQPRDTVYVLQRETGRDQYLSDIVAELRSQARSTEAIPVVSVAGSVRSPGEVPLESGMRVSDLVRAGGGLLDEAYSSKAEVTRYTVVDGEIRETSVLVVDLAAILGGDESANFEIEPYDHLNIQRVSQWTGQESVILSGEVVFPGEYPIRQGETLSSVLERAGGLTDLAYARGSVFTRVELREREKEQLDTLARRVESELAALTLSDPGSSNALSTGQALLAQLQDSQAVGRLVIRLDEIVAGNVDRDIVLEDGDQLIVPERPQEVTVLGEVQNPTSHAYVAGLDRGAYIDRSGGFTRRADKRRVYVVRANGEVVIGSGARWFQRGASLEIQPGDTVVAPVDLTRVRPLTFWTSVTQILYNVAIATAAVQRF